MSTFVIFSGLPGTGKSTLANRLARDLRWPLLRIDDVVGDVPDNAGINFWDSRVQVLLELCEAQLQLDINVIADSVFMNKDRNHAEAIAREQNALFRPIHTFMSDEQDWEKRVTRRVIELNNPAVATWDRIQHQRMHFRAWEPDTALFVDGVKSAEQNYADVLHFVTTEDVALKPLEEIPWVKGKYH